MRFVGWRGLSEVYRQAVEGHSPWRSDETNAQPVLIDDVAEWLIDDELKKSVRSERIGALAFFPLVVNDKLSGKFMTYYNAPHSFAGTEVEVSLNIARQLALAIERQLAEQTLRASEERLRLALEAGRMGTWEWNVQTGRINWSPELEAIHGLAPGSFESTLEAYRKDIHPQDWDEVQREIARSSEQDEHHIEYRIIRPDRAVRWIERHGKVFRNPEGKPSRLVGVCIDITDRKMAEDALRLSEQRYSLAISGTPVAVWECDRDLRFTFVDNPQPPLQDPTVYLGKRDDEILPLESVREVIELKERVLASGVGERCEVRIGSGDDTHWFDFGCEPIVDAANSIVGLRGAAVDVTDRRRREIALEESESDARLLQEIGAKMIAPADIQELYEKLVEAAQRIMRSQCASMQVLHPERGTAGELELLAHRGFTRSAAEFWQRVGVESESACGMALRESRRVIISDVETASWLACHGSA